MKDLSIGIITDLSKKTYIDQLQACINTWCNFEADCYYFNGLSTTPPGLGCNITSLQCSPNFEIEIFLNGLKYLIDYRPSKFYMFVRLETYVNVPELLKFLNEQDHTKRLYIGGHPEQRDINHESVKFFSGGSGIILSHATVELLYHIYSAEQLMFRWMKVSSGFLNSYDLCIAYFCNLLCIKYVENKYMLGYSNHQGRHSDDNTGCHEECEDLRKTPYKVVSCNYMHPPLMREFHEYLTKELDLTIISDWTLVTCFYNLPKYGAQFYRAKEFYLNYGEFILSLPVNLVIYCDEEDREHMLKFRESKGFLEQTKVVCKKLSDFELYDLVETIKENRIKTDHYGQRPDRLSHYSALTNIKFEMINGAIDNDYFNSNYYGWIDFGVCHFSGFYIHALIRALKVYRQKVSCCFIHYQPKDVVTNVEEYNRHKLFGMAAGFITGHKDYFHPACTNGIKYFRETVEAGYGHHEEQILHLIYHHHPELFDFYFGDYHQYLSNYDRIRSNPNVTINLVIRNSKNESNYEICSQACSKVLEAVLEDNLNISIDMLITLLDEYFIARYYLDEINKCQEILELHNKFANEYGKDYLHAFEKNGRQVISSSDYLRFKIDNFKKVEFNEQPSDKLINKFKGTHKILVYGDYPIHPNCLIHNQIVYRPYDLKI